MCLRYKISLYFLLPRIYQITVDTIDRILTQRGYNSGQVERWFCVDN